MSYQPYITYELTNNETKVVKSFQMQSTDAEGCTVVVLTVDGSEITSRPYRVPLARLLWYELISQGWVRR